MKKHPLFDLIFQSGERWLAFLIVLWEDVENLHEIFIKTAGQVVAHKFCGYKLTPRGEYCRINLKPPYSGSYSDTCMMEHEFWLIRWYVHDGTRILVHPTVWSQWHAFVTLFHPSHSKVSALFPLTLIKSRDKTLTNCVLSAFNL